RSCSLSPVSIGVLTGHRYEAHRERPLRDVAAIHLLGQQEQLSVHPFADRDDHLTPGLELRDERLRDLRRTRPADDAVEGGLLPPSEIAIPGFDLDIAVTELAKPDGGPLSQRRDDLDAGNGGT